MIARRVNTVDELEQPGDICFWRVSDDGQSAFMAFKCPCGQDVHARGHDSIAVRKGAAASDNGTRAWHWDGNMDAPTLSPSIQRTSGCMWHGYLAGWFVEICMRRWWLGFIDRLKNGWRTDRPDGTSLL